MNVMTKNEAMKLAVLLHREFNRHNTTLDLNFSLMENIIWTTDENKTSIFWNSDKDSEDLYLGEGNSYSAEVNWIIHEDKDYFLVNTNDGCGNYNEKLLFLKSEFVEWSY